MKRGDFEDGVVAMKKLGSGYVRCVRCVGYIVGSGREFGSWKGGLSLDF